jgi:lipopolysaccharide transport system ATP-binding protein
MAETRPSTRPIVEIRGVSKRYELRHERQERYQTIREAIPATVKSWLRPGKGDASRETFWALRDINLDIHPGDRLGIIGRNGAGKSTLLKILSRITEPSAGSITLRGRVASLLEVGTGFHPELTGRENIFLNGSILGMRRAEIRRKFDEIVAFAEVERFLDTPVKRYSSGMYVRLAFAVAAHLEPEILVIDEVLAVGDAQFQQKCIGKMRELSADGGRTLLIVSHQISLVKTLCNRALVLSKGEVGFAGSVDDGIRAYMDQQNAQPVQALDHRIDRKGTGAIRFTSVSLLDDQRRPVSRVASGQPFHLGLALENRGGGPLKEFHLSIGFDSPSSGRIAYASNDLTGELDSLPAGKDATVLVRFEGLQLSPGPYRLTLFCKQHHELMDWVVDASVIEVVDEGYYPTHKLPPEGQGHYLPKFRFTTG